MFAPEDHEELLTFLYQIPFGVARMDGSGELGLANPMTVQLMLQIDAGSTNLLETLDRHAPDLARSVRDYEGPAGLVLKEARVDFGVRGKKRPRRLCVVFSVSKLDEDRFMVVLREDSAPVEASSAG